MTQVTFKPGTIESQPPFTHLGAFVGETIHCTIALLWPLLRKLWKTPPYRDHVLSLEGDKRDLQMGRTAALKDADGRIAQLRPQMNRDSNRLLSTHFVDNPGGSPTPPKAAGPSELETGCHQSLYLRQSHTLRFLLAKQFIAPLRFCGPRAEATGKHHMLYHTDIPESCFETNGKQARRDVQMDLRSILRMVALPK